MTSRTVTVTLGAALGIAIASSHAGHGAGARTSDPPAGWFVAGDRPADYEMALDADVRDGGRPSARLRATVANAIGFGTLMQQVAAPAYGSQRMRLAGDLRVQGVTGWAALWMRVDGPCGHMLAFDNAQERSARGTADWQPQAVVLDVPAGAEGVAFRALLAGGGTAWVSHLRFEPVPDSVPVTAATRVDAFVARPCGPDAPVNLGLAGR